MNLEVATPATGIPASTEHWSIPEGKPETVVEFEIPCSEIANGSGLRVNGIDEEIEAFRDDEGGNAKERCSGRGQPRVANGLRIWGEVRDVLDRQIRYLDLHENVVVRQKIPVEIERRQC